MPSDTQVFAVVATLLRFCSLFMACRGSAVRIRLAPLIETPFPDWDFWCLRISFEYWAAPLWCDLSAVEDGACAHLGRAIKNRGYKEDTRCT